MAGNEIVLHIDDDQGLIGGRLFHALCISIRGVLYGGGLGVQGCSSHVIGLQALGVESRVKGLALNPKPKPESPKP